MTVPKKTMEKTVQKTVQKSPIMILVYIAEERKTTRVQKELTHTAGYIEQTESSSCSSGARSRNISEIAQAFGTRTTAAAVLFGRSHSYQNPIGT